MRSGLVEETFGTISIFPSLANPNPNIGGRTGNGDRRRPERKQISLVYGLWYRFETISKKKNWGLQ